MKLLFDESLSPRLVLLLRDLFPESESALQNGLARTGDRRILDYAAAHDFILVSTDSDFERLLRQVPGARVVIVRSCDYPTGVRPKCSGAMRSVSLNCPAPRII
jgi:predicted nuclease of predicted toxin-antitoxin system